MYFGFFYFIGISIYESKNISMSNVDFIITKTVHWSILFALSANFTHLLKSKHLNYYAVEQIKNIFWNVICFKNMFNYCFKNKYQEYIYFYVDGGS